ncbi:nitroreductase family deazaflavin-dependent oxidoreductase [Segniliparus rugosus]|uniref:Deazaflavin-dependent nitroreductase n=1 Tax=Segniliparus rugosus (strain ATCC BAA-974 / DSM 45345 / CCUG 50838 / CIP 108380 / JCM 13579 / CDC 945) TaxID=679197 RepID=E5XNX3_SEGRC|nr:nitroreductase family deazaflavin-dependent oxidoreductase [Segniliparus rugosus]EFV13942.1 deazaflavin-dependent nitroreductase [Segniliparus rugosus ATCC BAA-974]
MQLPQWLARMNRRVTNPVLGAITPWAPLFGTIKHKGRSSGKTYSTPVTLFSAPESFVVILTYGPDRDWLKNLAAAKGGEVVHLGKTVSIGPPRVLPKAEAVLPRLANAIATAAKFEYVAILPKS